MAKMSGGAGEVNGFLDSGCEVQGELRFENRFKVHGRFRGQVQSDGELIIGEGGVVEGIVSVGALSVSGCLKGQVGASRRVEIRASGRVEGEIDSPVLVVETGARLDGDCRMKRHEQPAAAPGGPSLEASTPSNEEQAVG